MNLSPIVTRIAAQTQFFLNKNAPTILTGAGVVGFIATTAATIRATNKANVVLPEISANIAVVKETVAIVKDGVYSEQDKTKALVKVYTESSLTMAKIYAPTMVLGSVSIVCVLAGHGIMLKRQASVVAAYTALDAGFKVYRKRVAERLGEDEELNLYRRPNTKIVESCDDEGKPCEIEVFDDSVMPSRYSKFFDESSPNWSKTPDYNLFFLRTQQDWANNRLRANGFLFLNEVYEALGLPRTQPGQMVGWKEGTEGGDGFVDFGLYQIGDESNRAFINGLEHTVLLDFNVDGIIKI